MRALADPEKAEQLEATLKAGGKWKSEAPAGDHHHGKSEEHQNEQPREHEHETMRSKPEKISGRAEKIE